MVTRTIFCPNDCPEELLEREDMMEFDGKFEIPSADYNCLNCGWWATWTRGTRGLTVHHIGIGLKQYLEEHPEIDAGFQLDENEWIDDVQIIHGRNLTY